MEGVPHQYRRAYGTEAYAKTLLHPAHIEDYEQYEIGDKTSGEDEKVLRFKPLVFHRPAYALVNRIFHQWQGLEEERAQDCGRDQPWMTEALGRLHKTAELIPI
jgi:hypothetical protein